MSAASSNRIPILQMIFSKMRRLTGSSDSYEMPDTPDPLNPNSVGLSDYVNSFYLYDFPAQFRSLKLKDLYTFDTVQGIDVYPFNSENYTTVEMPVTCMGRIIALYNEPSSFYNAYYHWQTQTNFTYGNGSVGPYGGFTSAKPLLRSYNNNPNFNDNPNYQASRVQNILITANTATSTLNATDDGNGNLIGDAVAGTINYFTGQIVGLEFNQLVPQGTAIQIQYTPYVASIPLGILFFQNQFTLRPVPHTGFTIQMVAYRQPSQALASTPAFMGNPELSEWWETIAVGASKKIYEDRLDPQGVALMDKMLQERYQANYTRTYAQLGKQRISTVFAPEIGNGGGCNWGGWGGNGGAV